MSKSQLPISAILPTLESRQTTDVRSVAGGCSAYAASSPNSHRNGGWIKRLHSTRGIRRLDNAKLVHRYVNASISNQCRLAGTLESRQITDARQVAGGCSGYAGATSGFAERVGRFCCSALTTPRAGRQRLGPLVVAGRSRCCSVGQKTTLRRNRPGGFVQLG